MSASDVAVLGVGMHPWGKWGRPFTEYGVVAARAALADAGIDWEAVDLVVGGETVRNGYAGYVAGATFAQALGWNGARVATSYAACATGAQALDTARARILAGLSEVALVVGANDVTNPAARRPGNPVSGMPILDVDHAKSVVVIKRSMGRGYAGLDNELYTNPKTGMFFADAKSGLAEITSAIKALVA